MTSEVFDLLLNAVRATHEAHPDLSDFCAFPEYVWQNPFTPRTVRASTEMQRAPGQTIEALAVMRDALLAAAPSANWLDVYQDTDIGEDFLTRFGFFGLIGDTAPFMSDTMRAWMVYMPAGLHYPFHQHPAEEMYLVVSGSAEFQRAGHPPKLLGPGDTVFHASNEPHATITHDSPLMAYVIWRNRFETPPVLTTAETGA
ncbi:dimethylsulfonioproprionate lyase family protein [Shimia sp.]|jgi:mannose-6-phosphate isomerase-like protein (cupin superfamily)|uniref:dimethylsulfonioproprionate lyase family protein n=1 Tax=unclassified Shimia TaxID=2630038 RepID=UPI0025FA27BF|nr:dimethylsulfonioproprionate lyase family protein [Shimia sp.]MCH2068836.1 dimethylsulfonioproprionate lyase family protein [Shimia sp.]